MTTDDVQRVKDGKMYDTTEATQVAYRCPNADRGDFGFLREVLYRTDNGNYFIYGEGGPRTKYSRSVTNGTAGGDAIIPKTAEKALEWCEDHSIDGEVIADEFEDLIEPA